VNKSAKELFHRLGKGLAIPGTLLFLPGLYAPLLFEDWRVWLLFILGFVLASAHPQMKFSRLGSDDKSAEDRHSLLVVNLGAYASFIPIYIHYALIQGKAFGIPSTTIAQVAAASVACGGILLRTVSIFTLGQWFTAAVKTTDDQELIQLGVYRFIRHPSYTGAMLFWGAIPFLLGLPKWAFVTWPILLAAYVWRIRVEEAALSRRFGGRYEEYKRCSSALLPFLY
jgi:protein-S-isoprenylcysteine O-methyltransferase